MELKLYDTLTREKRVFTPLDAANVRMYVCGPTVYDFAHIGNARPVIVFDVLFRLLRHIYGAAHVTYVRNITDVDDKINARAAEEYPALPLNEAIRKVTEKTDRQFHEDVAALGCLPPSVEPRATEHIAEMRTLIERLVKSGNAYVEQDHVLFSVAAMPDYGALSKRPLDEMIAGARVEVAPYKRAPMDFVLWKPSKPGEPSWPSPCGIAAPGRPGWHIECSAMSWKHLGETFDIHGGGIDLVFPHHENEIAQSRCAFHTPVMANYWMHNGFLQVEGEKMAKSLGNFVTIRDLLKDWPGETVRLAMLQTHYRQPLNWTTNGLREAQRTLDLWYELTGDAAPGLICADVVGAVADDLNSPKAVTSLHELRGEAAKGSKAAAGSLKASAQLLGLLQETASEWADFRPASISIDENKVTALIAARNAARQVKDFGESDRIRDELARMGVVVKDTKDGTTWEIAR
ncbi:MAG TPA: cysteine--tRNA ligase [Xanthobacteraceae bacterium]|jgi:cysteinyl-tRNA synthetase|nr:cysteine--tRNA ligase [Xanthobacteraceae bacterium]